MCEWGMQMTGKRGWKKVGRRGQSKARRKVGRKVGRKVRWKERLHWQSQCRGSPKGRRGRRRLGGRRGG